MAPQPENAARLVQLLIWIGGVATTIAGSWIASKVRLYHDDRRSHHQELKDKVLIPLRDLLAEQQVLFSHQVPVLSEKWGQSTMPILDARPDQDAFQAGAFLHANDPWPSAFAGLDRALFEDAKHVHYKKLMADIAALSNSWALHAGNCSLWVHEIAFEILQASKMNPYQPPYQPPYVNHLRLAVWIYRRLFNLPTEALRQSDQGRYWSIEGAPTVPNVSGVATLAKAEENTALLDIIDKIRLANRERATTLWREAEAVANQAGYLRSKVGYEIAKKKLRGRCDLVKFF